jgi:RimJ/RimL family protein N-acetyltransferase
MQIKNSKIEDIDTIFDLYDKAVAYQKTVFHRHWKGFDRAFIETEIQENRQFKIVIDNEVACIFAITFNDIFWNERNEQPSIFIHRIVTNPQFRGANFVNNIIDWAKQYCLSNDKKYIRMDTWGDNPKLIDYYMRCGFTYLETIDLENAEGLETLPLHYQGLTLALFEIVV